MHIKRATGDLSFSAMNALNIIMQCLGLMPVRAPHRWFDPYEGITHYPDALVTCCDGGRTLRTDIETPIEEHPRFALICDLSAWQRERVSRSGSGWIAPHAAREGARKGIS
jgi:hypothetical protein